MNDPWDVKSVRRSGHYVSCMKINGTPLLPPVLSQECRNEMKYYKLLAKEVERRIEQLKPYSEENDSDPIFDIQDAYKNKFDKTNASDLHADFDLNIQKVKPIQLENDLVPMTCNTDCDSIPSTALPKNHEKPHRAASPKFVIDLSVSINDSCHEISKTPFAQIEQPERDTNSPRRRCIKNRTVSPNNEKGNVVEVNFNSCFNKNVLPNRTDPTYCEDGPSSLGSKSFTGSLNNIHSECVNQGQNSTRLVRQRSYTVLEPSPQLMAHLEVESLNSGIEMTSISMSESVSNLSPMKKRRSWDLESAKMKWSTMALELSQRKCRNVQQKQHQARPTSRSPVRDTSSARARSVAYCRKVGIGAQRPASAKPDYTMEKASLKTDSSSSSLQASILLDSPEESPPENGTDAGKTSLKIDGKSSQEATLITPVSNSDYDDPATRVRELYDRIQKQQLMQMAKLVEKQKQEQCLLQQVFEQQNNVLYKQLKTICPKRPIEAKEAWTEKTQGDAIRGPVSLSQLIQKSPEGTNTSLGSTLTDTGHYMDHCEDVLKKSRDISINFRKVPTTDNGRSPSVTSRRRSSPPNSGIQVTPIRNNGNTHECDDAVLTDRTNDTMADLNFTLMTDDSSCDPYVSNGTCIVNDNVRSCKNDIIHLNDSISNNAASTPNCSTNKAAQKSSRVQNSARSLRKPGKQLFENKPPTQKEREAATKIVAYARGYLVRRLMGTERVQATVQTIRDALVCALQLHRDQESIRGADVDLHRRLIQQITAACYSLHETFVASSPAERCALVAADRARRRALAARPPAPHRSHSARTPDVMSRSHSGAFPPRSQRHHSEPAASAYDMTQSNYETISDDKWQAASRTRQVSRGEVRRRPWR